MFSSGDKCFFLFQVLVKEIDNKTMVIETLETKVETISSDLESSEYSELKEKLRDISEVHEKLSKSAASSLKLLSENAEFHKKYEHDFSEAEQWLQGRVSEFKKGTEFEPLKAYDVERKVAKLKKDLQELSDYEESKVGFIVYELLNFC